MATFSKNQIVRLTNVAGKTFRVAKTEACQVTGDVIVTVQELHPVTGQVDRYKMRFTADSLVVA